MAPEPLLLALTRPAMFWGVPAEAALTNLLVSFFSGALLSDHTIWRNPFMFWAVGVPVHMAMRRMISRDYHAFRTVWLWMVTFGDGTLESLPTRRPTSGKRCASSV
jgi:type IV secretory pathway VirB3-like protein